MKYLLLFGKTTAKKACLFLRKAFLRNHAEMLPQALLGLQAPYAYESESCWNNRA